ncbi:CDI toxin immunity protein, partial [Pasteurella multocida]
MKMNLFNECKIALHNSISVITKENEKKVIDLLNKYPIKDNWIDFNLAHYKEYEHIEMLP